MPHKKQWDPPHIKVLAPQIVIIGYGSGTAPSSAKSLPHFFQASFERWIGGMWLDCRRRDFASCQFIAFESAAVQSLRMGIRKFDHESSGCGVKSGPLACVPVYWLWLPEVQPVILRRRLLQPRCMRKAQNIDPAWHLAFITINTCSTVPLATQ